MKLFTNVMGYLSISVFYIRILQLFRIQILNCNIAILEISKTYYWVQHSIIKRYVIINERKKLDYDRAKRVTREIKKTSLKDYKKND